MNHGEHKGTKARRNTKQESPGPFLVLLRAFAPSCSLCLLLLLTPPAFAKDLTVAIDGSGDFKTVQAAIDAVPKENSERIIVHIKPGTYKEHLLIPKGK